MFGRSVVIEQRAKGVLAVGGDVIVKGRVEGDVATIGGNVLQGHDAYVGGDVIVFGGSYKALDTSPQRESGKETVVFGVFEDELRSLAQDPLRAVSPVFTAAFFAQRIVLALIWFVIGLAVTTIAPGAVGRASARIQLSPLKVCAVGAAGFILISAGMIAGGSSASLFECECRSSRICDHFARICFWPRCVTDHAWTLDLPNGRHLEAGRIRGDASWRCGMDLSAFAACRLDGSGVRDLCFWDRLDTFRQARESYRRRSRKLNACRFLHYFTKVREPAC